MGAGPRLRAAWSCSARAPDAEMTFRGGSAGIIPSPAATEGSRRILSRRRSAKEGAAAPKDVLLTRLAPPPAPAVTAARLSAPEGSCDSCPERLSSLQIAASAPSSSPQSFKSSAEAAARPEISLRTAARMASGQSLQRSGRRVDLQLPFASKEKRGKHQNNS